MIDTPSIDWAGLSPYLALLAGVAVIMLVAPFLPGRLRNGFGAVVALLCLAGAAGAAIALFALDDTGSAVVGDSLQRDRLADLSQVIVCCAGFVTALLGLRESDSNERRAEFYALLLSAVGGMAFFVAANDLISLFLGLEWFSISLYIMCALTVGRLPALESGLKYLIVGSFSSAVLLFGSALTFGATGETGFTAIADAAPGADRTMLVAGLALLIVGLAFKVSAAPFHQWTPDVYEGAATPVTGFMAAATKVAALVLTLRFLTTAFPGEAELWTITLGVLSAVSLAWGNLAALVQRNIKRLLAYSSISHAGFLLMPIAAGNALGGRALLYYLIPYAAMAVFMLGFIGLPPTGLFVGKFYVFSALYERGWIWLMILGAVFTAVSIYYYLGVVRSMYTRVGRLAALPAGGSPPRDLALDTAIVLSLIVAVGSFFAVDQLIELARDATSFLPFPF